MKDVNLDTAAITNCVERSKNEKLQHEKDNPAWSPRALRINGWRYSGILDPDLVTRAICSSFITQPKECKDIVKPRDPFGVYTGGPINTSSGVGFGTLLLWLFITVCLFSACLLLYKRYLKADMRTALREEVMLEVQAQMG